MLAALGATPAFMLDPGRACAASGTTILKADRLFDGFAFVSPGLVAIRGERIVGVNAGNIDAGARVIELGDATLLPGLIDCHTHIAGWLTASETELAPSDKFHADSVPMAAVETLRNAHALLRNGFTTIRDMCAEGGLDLGIRDSINRGLAIGPRIFASGSALSIVGGHGDFYDNVPSYIQPNEDEILPSSGSGLAYGPYGFRQRVRELVKRRVDVIKVMVTGGVFSFADRVDSEELNPDEVAAIVEEASKFGLKVAAHCHGDRGSHTAALAGVHSIEHCTGASQATLDAMKQRGTYLVPTLWALNSTLSPENHVLPVYLEKAKQLLGRRDPGFRRALDTGVKMAYGSDAGVFPHAQNNRDFALMREFGMSTEHILRTATSNAAELIGVRDRGRLSTGMLADIVAVPGDPRSTIRSLLTPSLIMLGGKMIDPTHLLA